jgi:quinol monooxygenase YgiN
LEDDKMFLTINIYYTGENGSARKFIDEMITKGIVDRIRKEEGNLKYEYFFPVDDNETVLLIDKWKNEEALDIHHKSEMMKEIAKLREKYNLKMRVEKYKD